MATTESKKPVNAPSIDSDPNKDIILIELAHVLWYERHGRKIENPEELHTSWQTEYPEFYELAQQLVRDMYRRGMMLNFYDLSLAQFAPREES